MTATHDREKQDMSTGKRNRTDRPERAFRWGVFLIWATDGRYRFHRDLHCLALRRRPFGRLVTDWTSIDEVDVETQQVVRHELVKDGHGPYWRIQTDQWAPKAADVNWARLRGCEMCGQTPITAAPEENLRVVAG